MKIARLFLLIFLCSLTHVTIKAQFSFSPPVSVTNGDQTFGFKNPKLALDSQGELLIHWRRTGAEEAFFISRLIEGSFSSPQEIPFGSLHPNLWVGNQGPSFASHAEHIYLTFEVMDDAIYVIHSGDNGYAWDEPVIAFLPPQGRRASFPAIACDEQGQPYISYMNASTVEPDAYYGMVRSLDYGSTFFPEVLVNEASQEPGVCEWSPGHIEVGANGDVYVAYRNNDDYLLDIRIARSQDGGNSFNAEFDVDETDWIASVCPSNGPDFIIEDDRVVSTFFSGSSTWGSGIYFSCLELDNDAVLPTQALPYGSSSSTFQNHPRITGLNDTIGVVWQEMNDNSLDIAVAYSVNGEAGLLENFQLISTADGAQQFPQILFHNGIFHVVYEDVPSGTVMYQSMTDKPLGLSEIDSDHFSVYPNPSSGLFRFSQMIEERSSMFVFDILGATVSESIIQPGESQLDLSHLGPGYYSLILMSDKIERRFNVIIE